jgi:hypothetical protein
MAVRWRELFDHLQVPWTDSSRYAGHGWIALHCVWCGSADPSTHLGINEEHGHYRCLRNEDHRGRSPYYLLAALGVRHSDMDDLLRQFGGVLREHSFIPTTHSDHVTPVLAQRWARRLKPATGDDRALDYLWRRRFDDPGRTARDFDLRVGEGRWGGRLWLKLTEPSGAVIGFTGRAMDDWRQPRYYTEAEKAGLYIPRPPSPRHRLGILVEGPIDALKIADATRRRYNLFVAALCGLTITGNRRLQLSEIARQVPWFAVALDSSVWTTDAQKLISELRAVPALGRVTRLALPPDKDDPGEMTTLEVEQWLSAM